MKKSDSDLEETKRLMAALGRMPPKPHEEMKLGKARKHPKNGTILDAALEYAADSGLRLFPCNPATKAPLVRWSTEATNDQAKIRAWWTRWPDAMIGLPSH